ncbi:MAG: aldehyde dehydrogenase family protein [Pseudomonadota bacterium]
MPIETRPPAAPEDVAATHAETRVDTVGAAHIARAARPRPERGALIARLADAWEAQAADIAMSITNETAKPLAEVQSESPKPSPKRAPLGDISPSQIPGGVADTTPHPRGAILGNTPCTFPFSTPSPAILWKPTSPTPGAMAFMADSAAEPLPVDLVQAVIGGGAPGQALSDHAGVDAARVGRRVAIAAAGHLTETSLELDAKTPGDPRRRDVLDQILAAAFAGSGHKCLTVSRIIAHRDLQAAEMEPTDGTADGAKMGPLDDVDSVVTRAEADVATIAAGGGQLGTATGGAVYAPTILPDTTREMDLTRPEVFGPVPSVIANDVASCRSSKRTDMVERVAKRESGMPHLNARSFPKNHRPFVRTKDNASGDRPLKAPDPHNRARCVSPG